MPMKKTDYPAVGETLYESVLPNGLSVFVIPKPGYRKTFAVFAASFGGADRRFVRDGAERETPAGVAHYLEHKMFDMPDGDALMALTAAGADPNAFTSEDMTAYHFECTDRFDESLRTLLSFVSEPYFTPESVDRERGIIAQEIRMVEDAPDFAVYMDLMRCLFPAGHPLRDAVAGTVDSIRDITPETLYDCHRAFYIPSNMALCVVGNTDPESVERIARDVLRAESLPAPEKRRADDGGLRPVETFAHRRMEVAAPLFMIGAKLGPASRGPEAQRERIIAALALRCLVGRSSPFYLRQYADGLLNSTFGADVDYSAGQTVLAFDGETPGDPRRVLDALTEELTRVQREGVDRALFDRQKKASLGARIRGLMSFEGLGVSLASAHFAGFRAMDGFEVLGSLTAEDADAWLRRIDPNDFALAVVEPKEG